MWHFDPQKRRLSVLKMSLKLVVNTYEIRMHSSRMRTVLCSGRLGGVCQGEGVSDQGGVCIGGQSAQEGCLPRRVYTTPRGQNDRHLWKHYIFATTVADSNNSGRADFQTVNGVLIWVPSVSMRWRTHFTWNYRKRRGRLEYDRSCSLLTYPSI